MKNLIVVIACLLTVTICYAATDTAPELSCPTPKNVAKTSETSSSISFNWDDCGSCSPQSFLVYYVKDGKASATFQTSSSNFTFTNLDAGVYEFHFSTDCAGTESAEIIIIEELVIA